MPKLVKKAAPAVISPAALEIKRAISEMNTELKTVYDKISMTARTANASEITTRYEYGKWIYTVMLDKRKYGDNAAKLLAVALGISESLLYSFRGLYLQWKDNYSTFKTLIERKNAAGITLSFSHFVAISKVPEAKDRLALIETTLSDCLSVDDLTRLVAERYGTGPVSKNTTVLPRNPASGIAVMSKALVKVVDGHKRMQVSVLENIESKPDDYTDSKTVEKLSTLMEDIKNARLLLDEDVRRIQATLDTLERLRNTDDGDDGDEPEETPVPRKIAAAAPTRRFKANAPPRTQPSKITAPPSRTTPNASASDVVSRIKDAQAARAAQGTKRVISV